MNPQVIRARLQSLHSDLATMSPDGQVAWPLARVFNALLAEAREVLGDDPVVNVMSSIKAADKNNVYGLVQNGTLRALAGQLVAALEAPARQASRGVQRPAEVVGEPA